MADFHQAATHTGAIAELRVLAHRRLVRPLALAEQADSSLHPAEVVLNVGHEAWIARGIQISQGLRVHRQRDGEVVALLGEERKVLNAGAVTLPIPQFSTTAG